MRMPRRYIHDQLGVQPPMTHIAFLNNILVVRRDPKIMVSLFGLPQKPHFGTPMELIITRLMSVAEKLDEQN